MCPVDYHSTAAVGAIDKTREHIRLVHMLRRPLLVLADVLYDIPQLL